MLKLINQVCMSVVLTSLCFCTLATAATPVTRVAVETSWEVTKLPATFNSEILLRPCDTCPPVVVRLTPRTRFIVGEKEITLGDFGALASGQRDSVMLMVISYDPSTREVDTVTGWL